MPLQLARLAAEKPAIRVAPMRANAPSFSVPLHHALPAPGRLRGFWRGPLACDLRQLRNVPTRWVHESDVCGPQSFIGPSTSAAMRRRSGRLVTATAALATRGVRPTPCILRPCGRRQARRSRGRSYRAEDAYWRLAFKVNASLSF